MTQVPLGPPTICDRCGASPVITATVTLARARVPQMPNGPQLPPWIQSQTLWSGAICDTCIAAVSAFALTPPA